MDNTNQFYSNEGEIEVIILHDFENFFINQEIEEKALTTFRDLYGFDQK